MKICEIKDICELLKIGKSTAYNIVGSQELPAFKLHGV
ncbi:MAG: helix-turn-helix domain-containing protein [Lachnospiraceae bacterium]